MSLSSNTSSLNIGSLRVPSSETGIIYDFPWCPIPSVIAIPSLRGLTILRNVCAFSFVSSSGYSPGDNG